MRLLQGEQTVFLVYSLCRAPSWQGKFVSHRLTNLPCQDGRTTRPQALAQALAPRLALVGCLGGALVGLALAQGSTKARQGLVVPWLMETHQG